MNWGGWNSPLRHPLYGIAVHEAGHAVAAALLDMPIEHVSIVPNEDDDGRVIHGGAPLSQDEERTLTHAAATREVEDLARWWSLTHGRRLRDLAIVAYAGSAACWIERCGGCGLSPRDRRSVHEYRRWMRQTGGDPRSFWKHTCLLLKLSSHRKAARTLARALVVRRMIEGEEAVAIIREAIEAAAGSSFSQGWT